MSIRVKRYLLFRYRSWKSQVRAFAQATIFIGKVLSARKVQVVIGSSGLFGDGWISSECEFLDMLNEKHWRRAFQWRKIDALLAEHVLEHLTMADAPRALGYCHKYMKNGARFRIAVPDGYSPDQEYIQMVRPGGSGEGSDDHKVLFNIESLETILNAAGFSVVGLEYFDAEGVFRKTEWSARDGMISRCLREDPRNQNGRIGYTSLIVDAFKI